MKYSENPRLYHIWNDMIRRCYKPVGKWVVPYKNIFVCEEWKDYPTFVKWAVESGYQDHLTIDRIDNDKNYEPSNCRWLTMKEQQRNKKTNRMITYNGETKCMAQWAEELGINKRTLAKRFSRGMELERAMQNVNHKYKNN